MLNFEHYVKLGTLALLGVFFISLSAVAEKENSKNESSESSGPVPQLSLVQEAELINSGGLNAYQLTRIGNSIEINSASAVNLK